MLNNNNFAAKALDIANNYRTGYMLGAFGWPTTPSNLNRLLSQYPENYEYVNNAKNNDYCFDCVGLIKGIIWGWNGNANNVYGGATYASNNMPDIDADSLKSQCSDISSNFSSIEIGEILLMSGHCGIYVGNNQVVECTPIWKHGVQITSLSSRNWTYHGKLKCISYSSNHTTPQYQPPGQSNHAVPAQYFDRNIARTYIVSPSEGLNVRKGPGTQYEIIKAITQGTTVTNYGYYSIDSNGDRWLYVMLQNKTVGYIHSAYVR